MDKLQSFRKGKKKVECGICGMVLQEHSLKKHTLLIHKKLKDHKLNNGAKTLECELCGKILRRDSLQKHLALVHKENRDYKCSVCLREFKASHHLTTHVKTVHNEERNYKCNECGKSFSRGGVLNKHIKAVHKGTREHKCSICGNAFNYKSALEKHIKALHNTSKEVLINCQFCPYKSNNKQQLSTHVKAVHLNYRDFTCKTCGEAFSYKHVLQNHVIAAGSLYLYTSELGTTAPPELYTSRLLYDRLRQNKLRYNISYRNIVHHWKQEFCTTQKTGILYITDWLNDSFRVHGNIRKWYICVYDACGPVVNWIEGTYTFRAS